MVNVVYFDQLSGAARTQKLVETKIQPKKDKFKVTPQGVDQLLHVDQL